MVDDAEKKLLADVGYRIRETRAAQGLSLEQLARLTGISAPALSLIETGKREILPRPAFSSAARL